MTNMLKFIIPQMMIARVHPLENCTDVRPFSKLGFVVLNESNSQELFPNTLGKLELLPNIMEEFEESFSQTRWRIESKQKQTWNPIILAPSPL